MPKSLIDTSASLATSRPRRQIQKPKKLSYTSPGQVGDDDYNDASGYETTDEESEEDKVRNIKSSKVTNKKETQRPRIPKPLVIYQESEEYAPPYSLESLFYEDEEDDLEEEENIPTFQHPIDQALFVEDILDNFAADSEEADKDREYMYSISDPEPLVQATSSRRWLVRVTSSLPEVMKKNFINQAHFHACTTHDIIASCKTYREALERARRARLKYPRFSTAMIKDDDIPPFSTTGLPMIQDTDEDILISIEETTASQK